MAGLFSRLFRDHPVEVGETYLEHAATASGYGLRLLAAAGYCFAHALVPGLFKTHASDRIKRMAGELEGRVLTAREERMRRANAIDPGL